MAELTVSLWITLVGMALVFGVILLLWGLILLIVRLTNRAKSKDQAAPSIQAAIPGDHLVEQRLAAALAVSVALAQARLAREIEAGLIQEFPLPPTASVSPWQAVNRSKILNSRGPVR